MARLTAKYYEGRARGLEIAKRDYEVHGGRKAIETEMRFRRQSKVLTDACVFDLNDACKDIKDLSAESHLLMYLIVNHDEFGHGKKRLTRSIDRFTQKSKELVDLGIMGWVDYYDNVTSEYKIDIDFSNIRDEKVDLKLPEYDKGREDGLEYAYRTLINSGEQGFYKLFKQTRDYKGQMNQTKLRKIIDEAVDVACDDIKFMSMKVFSLLSIMVNKELYRFGEKRTQKFINRKEMKLDCLVYGLVSWMDMVETLIEETGIDYNFDLIRKEKWEYGHQEKEV